MAERYRVKILKEEAFKDVAEKLKGNKYCKKEFADSLQQSDFCLEYKPLVRTEYRIKSISWRKEETSLERTGGYRGTISGDSVSLTPDYDSRTKIVEYSTSTWKKDNRFANIGEELTWTVSVDDLTKYKNIAETEVFEETFEMAEAREQLIERRHKGIYPNEEGYVGVADKEADKYLKSKGFFTLPFYNTIEPSVEYRDETIFLPTWICEKDGHTIKVDAVTGEVLSLGYEENDASKSLYKRIKRANAKYAFSALLSAFIVWVLSLYFIVYAFADLLDGPGEHVVAPLIALLLGIAGFFVLIFPWCNFTGGAYLQAVDLEFYGVLKIFESGDEKVKSDFEKKFPSEKAIVEMCKKEARERDPLSVLWLLLLIPIAVSLVGLVLVIVTTKGVGFWEHVRRIFTFDWSVISPD